jgi:nucleotidyltransferase substrate binding protein (TIGR01987 family)
MQSAEENNIRWKQRFSNFKKAYAVYKRLCLLSDPSEGEEMGLIQAFEILFELSWKVLQDYLKEQGYLVKGPRNVLKQAFQDGIINEGHTWLEALEKRNQTVHMYDNDLASALVKTIRDDYHILFDELHDFLKEKD